MTLNSVLGWLAVGAGVEDGRLLAVSYGRLKQLNCQKPRCCFVCLQLIGQRLCHDIKWLEEKFAKAA